MVPSELMRLRIVALLFSVAMKSTYSAMRSAMAGRLDCFFLAHQASYCLKSEQ